MFEAISRRLFLAGGISLGATALPPPKKKTVYSFATDECKIRMTVEFYDRYSSSTLSFRDLSAGRRFCVSPIGEFDRDCAAGFVGSLAIARYAFQPHSGLRRVTALREHVRTIDQDARLPYRPPFDRAIELHDSVASDIQAFGYETTPPALSADAEGPWYYFRQDLYFAGRPTAFLVVHWRHTFGAIRILDVIPGARVWPVKQAP